MNLQILLLITLYPGVLCITNCGMRPQNYTTTIHNVDRIVGGHRSRPGSWPWMVNIFLKFYPMVICSATLIDERWVVTAAHCFDSDLDTDEWVVQVGKYSSNHDETYTRTYDILKIIKHPQFDDTQGVFNDICLLQLNETVEFESVNYYLNNACLANYETMKQISWQNCFITGWGLDQNNGSSSKYLKELRLPIVESAKCYDKFGFHFDANTQICAGGMPDGGFGTCYGDSGGPLQCLLEEKWYLMGITSYGKPCALPSIPDVFTKVAFYHDWILEQINSTTL